MIKAKTLFQRYSSGRVGEYERDTPCDNLDPAFNRRFLFKTEMEAPDAKARFKIWKSLMRDINDEDSRILADEYTIAVAGTHKFQ